MGRDTQVTGNMGDYVRNAWYPAAWSRDISRELTSRRGRAVLPAVVAWKTDDAPFTDGLRAEIVGGKDFAAVAKANSDDTASKDSGTNRVTRSAIGVSSLMTGSAR